MPIAAILLFGSLARGDQAEGSDTDILMISDDATGRHISAGHLSMFFYPWSQLVADARDGNLFVCHLVRKSKPIFDPDDYLPKLGNAFELRKNYDREISQAADLGWFLIRFSQELNPALLAKRIIWCVRTILIARSAEANDPVFAPAALADRSKSAAARELLSERHNRFDEAVTLCRFRRFLVEETLLDPFHQQANRAEFIERFDNTFNKVALTTLAQEEQSQLNYR